MAGVDEEERVVLYPSPGLGHLVSMVEFGKLLVNQHGLKVTVLIVEANYHTGSTSSFISAVSGANPSISFHHLPRPEASLLPPNSSPHHEAHAFDLLRQSNPALLDFLRNHASRALVVDNFCIFAISVTRQLGLPCYCFYTSGANVLAYFLHFPHLHLSNLLSFRELGGLRLHIPGLPPLPADHAPLPMLDRDDEAYKGFLEISKLLPEADGVLINTALELEPRAVEAISSGACMPQGVAPPPVWCIGPLINEDRQKVGGAECMAWLDKQPEGSVVFLCFGSLGLFSVEQLGEIAKGLERSGQRFLWVVKNPPAPQTTAKFMVAPPERDLKVLLPEGFLDRIGDRGLVVKSWAPQVDVLRHVSIGGFLTHCGWNSVLEAVHAGVPMLGWPLYAEQEMNVVFLEEEMKLAVAMKGYHDGFVAAEEVETKVRWLMDSDGGRELRRRTLAAKESAAAAVKVGGSSHSALLKVIGQWKNTT